MARFLARVILLTASLSPPTMTWSHSAPSEEQREIIDAALQEISTGKLGGLWRIQSIKQDSISIPANNKESQQMASPAQIGAFISFAKNPGNYHVADWGNYFLYPCAQFLLPGSEIHVTGFHVSGNANGTLIGGADISVIYSDASKSPVIYLDDHATVTHNMKSANISVMYTAEVGSPDILDPVGQFFIMDKENCQVKSSTDW